MSADAEVIQEFDSFRQFLEGAASKLSADGIFLSTEKLAAPGSRVSFELRIRQGFRLLAGDGQVVWNRDAGASEATDPGVAVRFVHLDESSRLLLPKLLAHFERENVELLDLGTTAGIEGPEAEIRPAVAEPFGDLPTAKARLEEDTATASPVDEVIHLEDLMAKQPLPGAEESPPGPEMAEEGVSAAAGVEQGEASFTFLDYVDEVSAKVPWWKSKDLWIPIGVGILAALIAAAVYYGYLRDEWQLSSRLIATETVAMVDLEPPAPPPSQVLGS
jgi:uncharacterized protein (TIGR02266 family)